MLFIIHYFISSFKLSHLLLFCFVLSPFIIGDFAVTLVYIWSDTECVLYFCNAPSHTTPPFWHLSPSFCSYILTATTLDTTPHQSFVNKKLQLTTIFYHPQYQVVSRKHLRDCKSSKPGPSFENSTQKAIENLWCIDW